MRRITVQGQLQGSLRGSGQQLWVRVESIECLGGEKFSVGWRSRVQIIFEST